MPRAEHTRTQLTRACAAPGCLKNIPEGKRSDALYCGQSCTQAAWRMRKKKRQIIERREKAAPEDYGKTQLSDKLSHAAAQEVLDLTDDGWGIAQIALSLNLSRSLVYQTVYNRGNPEIEEVTDKEWSKTPEVAWMLGDDLELPDPRNETESFIWAEERMWRFIAFEHRYFRLPGGKPFLRAEFHYEWIREVFYSIATGGYLQIMAPPRHGKSELMVHVSVYLICQDPNIRILWVGPSTSIAADMTQAVGEVLEFNKDLIAETLPVHESYAPHAKGPGVRWGREEFRVENRDTGIVGSTMTAIGRGGKILSRNADIIYCDDIEDYDSTSTPSKRSGTRRWAGITLDSRKEEHTALMYIGSRQHYDDLYGHNDNDPNFRVVVNSAHDSACVLPEASHALHVECMLFSELRSHRWLMSKQQGADAKGEEGVFEMVYLNDPQTEGYAIFIKDELEASKNPLRVLGTDGLPHGVHLIGGLDPSATGYQAGFCWAVKEKEGYEMGGRPETNMDRRYRRWMVDLDNRLGGGMDHALSLMEAWRLRYKLRHWVIEENMWKTALRWDPRIKEWARIHDVTIETIHTSGKNKHDPSYGVGAMSRLWTAELVDLPYGDDESRRKTNDYIKQLLGFTEDLNQLARRRTDIHMASWFPQDRIRRWEKADQLERSRVSAVKSDYPVSYPGLDRFTDLNTAPW